MKKIFVFAIGFWARFASVDKITSSFISSFVSVIVNIVTWSAAVLDAITYSLGQVRITLTSQLLKGISRLCQKLLNGTLMVPIFFLMVSIFFVLLASVTPVIFCLHLKN